MKTHLIFREECFQVIGACFSVYNELGSGFLESIYSEALRIELHRRSIPFVSEREIQIHYRQVPLKQSFRVDLICFEKLIVELKATESLIDAHRSQLLNYLNATQLRLGVLVNFGNGSQLEWERLVR